MATVKLSKPLKVGEAEVTELVLKLEQLTGADGLRLAMQASQRRGHSIVLELRLDEFYQLEVAAEATGLTTETLRALPLPDFLAVMGAVRDFLGGLD